MKSKGITRIELAVVVAIIVVSAAVLLPAFGAGKVTDKLTGCLRRTLGLSAAILVYTEDYNGILPPGKYGHQSGYPVQKVWMNLLYDLEYVEEKEDFQCPADDVTDNEALYYDYGPPYPWWFTSYAMPMNLCDLFWDGNHTPYLAVLANHEGMLDKQVLLGESECNFISGYWFGWGDAHSFKMTYIQQFPFGRHKGFCTYAMLDGRAKVMRVPSSDATDAETFRTEVESQFEECDVEMAWHGGSTDPHVCLWNRYRRGVAASHPIQE